ncbi:TetR/AcrR family transcriptional regulator [Christensenellaceae bacterium OttesenSCG-928-M15]|nr:TetR/AcrR family transcriptional regulator [Christensenellaceae bacterium OttesenSCG-928-M15]
MDRRKQKSRKIIMEAFIDLLNEKDIEKISLIEIANRANVNRGTIYLNFIDKYDLLDQCIDENLSEVFRKCRDSIDAKAVSNSKESILMILGQLEARFDFYKTLLKNTNLTAFRKRIHDEAAWTIRAVGFITEDARELQSEIAIEFLASGISGALEWWFNHSTVYSSEQIVDELWNLAQKFND